MPNPNLRGIESNPASFKDRDNGQLTSREADLDKEKSPKERLLKIQERESAKQKLLDSYLSESASRRDLAAKGYETANPALENKIKSAVESLRQLEKEEGLLLSEHGDDVDSGQVVADGEKNPDTHGMRLDANLEESAELSKEERKKIIDNFKVSAVKKFVSMLENNWYAKDAANLELVMAAVRNNVPNLIDKRTKAFQEGQIDDLVANVWFKFEHNSLWDKITGKPNQLKNIRLIFEDGPVGIANDADIAAEQPNNEQEPDSGSVPKDNLKRAA